MEVVPPLNGIKGFRSWFETTYSDAVTTISPEQHDANGYDGRNRNRNNGRGGKKQAEVFDHVLIDANQYLHSSLRKAHNRRVATGHTSGLNQQQVEDDVIDHCLLLFLRDLKRITTTTAIPRRSLVIAIDGSPAAAKLGTQRRRRSSIYKKAAAQERQIEVLKENGWRDNDFGFYSNSIRKKGFNPLFSKHEREMISLNITPGTAFMDRVTEALLYWSWQYVSKHSKVRVYLSPSCVHGEGEIKLLDWILHGHDQDPSSPRKRRTNIKQNNETVAILGGDSDLVLMGLVVPPEITPNVHVILPGVKGKSLVVSIWKTTLAISRMIEGTSTYGDAAAKKKSKKRSLTLNQINQVRIDMALMIMMTGNDYLPGLRSAFDSFFTVYLDLTKKWLDKQSIDEGLDPFLVTFDEDNQLCFNVPFALAFFRAMSSSEYVQKTATDGSEGKSTQSLLGTLINLAEAKILPTPLSFRTISPEESFFQQELWQMNEKLGQNTSQVMEEVFAEGAEIIRLTLGHFPENTRDEVSSLFTTSDVDGHGVISRVRISKDRSKAGGRAYLFEVPHRSNYSSIKKAKNRLASLALEEMFGPDNVDKLFGDGYSEENENESLRDKPQSAARADSASYLGGLLWNLETYNRGCCGDYGFDYGWRASPSSFELVEFLESVKKQGMLKINYNDLVDKPPAPPVTDGLACLATTPPQAFRIVPEPYSWLVAPGRSDSFEDLYNSCFDPETTAFNIQAFLSKCNAEVSKIRNHMNDGVEAGEDELDTPGEQNATGRHIYASSKAWTILSLTNIPLAHPFEPPEPFSDRVRRLKKNKRMRATRQIVKTRNNSPRSGAADDGSFEYIDSRTGRSKTVQSIDDIPYRSKYTS